jgi:predicted permease
LLAAAGLMLRSLGNLLHVEPGFDLRNLLTLRLSIPRGSVPTDSLPGFQDGLRAAVGAVPGVTHAALSDCAPLSGGCSTTVLTFDDRVPLVSGPMQVGVHWVTPDWFETLDVPLKRGRRFTAADRLNSPKVVLISEEAARRYFPGEDPIGRRVAVHAGFEAGADVIGVVGDVRYGTIDSPPQPDVYISLAQDPFGRTVIFARGQGDPAAIAPGVREAVRRFSPHTPVYDVRSMSARRGAATAQARISAVLLTLFAGVALSLAAIGIYGVMSFAVARRAREIGVCMALGASASRVRNQLLCEGAVVGAAGLVFGLAAAGALTRVLRSQLFGVTPADAVTYVVIVVVAAGGVFAASWLPARKAARLDPMVTLRSG